MKKTLTIRSEEIRDNAINLIKMIPLDVKHEVIIRPYSETLLQKQRALYYRWVGIMAAEWGNEKTELHLDLKKEFLVPILVEQNKKYRGWVERYISLKDSDPQTAELLFETILAATSIADGKLVTKSIMAEFMTVVERYSNQTGCFLPRPGE